jgi:ferritin-like metal-binding protein YciE
MITQNINNESFIKGLQAMWSAEQMLTEAMPGMIERATSLGLKKNLALHLAETDQHKVAIEIICKQLGYNHEGAENADMKAILVKGQQTMNAMPAGEQLDAAIISGAIKVEHYEIAQYAPLGDLAENLGFKGIAQRLRLSYEEERQAHIKLHFLDKNLSGKSAVLGIEEKA